VPKEQVQSVLALCDLLYFAVHPSKVWRFGLSLNKLIDYMLSAKPVLASYTGHPSMIDEAGAGSFAPAGDAAALKAEILRYASLPQAERREMGLRGRSWLLEKRRYPRLARDYCAVALPASVDTMPSALEGDRPHVG
jgi:glycosyltransferase involved in cell wall biosynthesis